jgi:hypothetical protein
VGGRGSLGMLLLSLIQSLLTNNKNAATDTLAIAMTTCRLFEVRFGGVTKDSWL